VAWQFVTGHWCNRSDRLESTTLQERLNRMEAKGTNENGPVSPFEKPNVYCTERIVCILMPRWRTSMRLIIYILPRYYVWIFAMRCLCKTSLGVKGLEIIFSIYSFFFSDYPIIRLLRPKKESRIEIMKKALRMFVHTKLKINPKH